MYKVHIGYTQTGRDRWRKFDTLDQANTFCNAIMRSTGKILTVILEG